MSIVISHKTLSLKTKGKTKANIAPLNEGDVEDFSAKVDTAVGAEPHIDKQAKNISKPQTLKNPNQKDNQDVAQEPKDQIQSASTKLTQHNNVQTADILAKTFVAASRNFLSVLRATQREPRTNASISSSENISGGNIKPGRNT